MKPMILIFLLLLFLLVLIFNPREKEGFLAPGTVEGGSRWDGKIWSYLSRSRSKIPPIDLNMGHYVLGEMNDLHLLGDDSMPSNPNNVFLEQVRPTIPVVYPKPIVSNVFVNTAKNMFTPVPKGPAPSPASVPSPFQSQPQPQKQMVSLQAQRPQVQVTQAPKQQKKEEIKKNLQKQFGRLFR